MPTLSDTGRHRSELGAAEAAASWFARLRSDKVSVQDLIAFQLWRNDPVHDAAYRQVEALWSRGETLRSDPDIALALSAGLNRRRGHVMPQRACVVTMAAAWALIALVLGVWTVSEGYLGAQTYDTAVGRQKDVHLADGSVVRLDTDSRLRVRLAAGGRYLDLLRGRAFFNVAHDPSRPFLVSAGHARVRAVGTRFSVQAEASDVRVILVQGVVAVSSSRASAAPAPVRLVAGQELTVDGVPSTPHAVDVSVATSWLQNQLVFRNLPLRDAIAEVNRYTARKLVLEAEQAADTPVSGVFETRDPRAFATAAADVCGLVAVDEPDGTVRLQSPGRPD